MQEAYRLKLLELTYRKVIYFFDETSINLWLTNKRTWTGTENPITLPL